MFVQQVIKNKTERHRATNDPINQCNLCSQGSEKTQTITEEDQTCRQQKVRGASQVEGSMGTGGEVEKRMASLWDKSCGIDEMLRQKKIEVDEDGNLVRDQIPKVE